MSLSLRESKAIADMAELLYDFLPGSGSVRWKGHVSFKSVAEKVGVGNFWQVGSKIPMITALYEAIVLSEPNNGSMKQSQNSVLRLLAKPAAP